METLFKEALAQYGPLVVGLGFLVWALIQYLSRQDKRRVAREDKIEKDRDAKTDQARKECREDNLALVGRVEKLEDRIYADGVIRERVCMDVIRMNAEAFNKLTDIESGQHRVPGLEKK